jgi:ParB family chromosome partitioning protein
MNKPLKGLGRGLSALIADSNEPEMIRQQQNTSSAANDSVPAIKLALTSIKPGRFQPRSYFNQEDLADLSESIRKNGVVQPVIVRAVTERDADYPRATHELIAGERRWRAAALVGLDDIPAIVMELNDKQALEIALIENIQRQNLTPLEIAEGYQRLIAEFSYTQEQLAEVIGKSRTQITNFLRLLSLPQEIKDLLNKEKISVGHARALLSSPEPIDAVNKIILRGLSVRQAEKLIQNTQKPRTGQAKKKAPISFAVEAIRREGGEENNSRKEKIAAFIKLYHELIENERDPYIIDLEKVLSKNLGMTLHIIDENEKGKIVMHYHTIEELDSILRKLERLVSL